MDGWDGLMVISITMSAKSTYSVLIIDILQLPYQNDSKVNNNIQFERVVFNCVSDLFMPFA